MGREVRRVSLTWEHPKDKEGHFIPLHDSRRYEMGDDKSHYMPFWEKSEKTCYQMYETTSEGTPISPVFRNPEELAKWLYENKVPAYSDMTASYDAWFSIITNEIETLGFCTMNGNRVNGVDYFYESEKNLFSD